MGKLNLLHHKDWHVYNKDNREKVIKDEREAFEKQVIQADQERRIATLRDKAAPPGKRKKAEVPKDHLNLFADYEKRVVEMDKLKDEDKQKAEDKWEKQFTTYLVNPVEDGETRSSPWYAQHEIPDPCPVG
jgi:phosphoenolpyruvate-protein kinase (PTS system EI component)